MNDNSHEQFGAADARRDGKIRNDQSTGDLVGSGAGVGLQTDRAGAEGAPVPATEQRATRDREALSSQDHRIEPSPTDATDPALDGYAADREKAGATPELPPALQRRRHRLVSRGRCRSRGSLRSGGAAPLPPGMGGVWQREVPATGGHFGLAYLQPAPVGRLTGKFACGWSTPRGAKYRSGSVASRNQKGGRVTFVWTPFIRGSTTGSRECITSMRSTR